MDFCHQCQRHLNGALACAGCGTPAEELRHDDPHTSAADDLVIELSRDEEPPAGPRRARTGQANRRRSRSAGRRARKRRGRKVLIGLGALVLAAGALSLAELAIEHPGEDGAATAVRQDDMAETAQPAPNEPSGDSERPDGPSPISASASTVSDGPSGDDEPGEGDGDGEGVQASGVPGASASPGAPSPGASAPGAPGAPTASPAPGEPGAPAPEDPALDEPDPGTDPNPEEPGQGDGDPPSKPAPEPPPSQPSPDPTPTESCDWFLWWCV
ncbi:hypothetical protein ACIRNI_14765 [Streptomyces sp. NPDC093546]|uniref:SCO2400 family protein n=1 Tax=Streptomyces sp. NPDC093546 TaxID=3366040 RepID=UPI00381A6343